MAESQYSMMISVACGCCAAIGCSCGDQNSNWMEKIQAVGSIAYQ